MSSKIHFSGKIQFFGQVMVNRSDAELMVGSFVELTLLKPVDRGQAGGELI